MSLFRRSDRSGVPPAYKSRLEALLGSPVDGPDVEVTFTWESPEEARQQLDRIGAMQQELRSLKKDVTRKMKAVRDSYGARRAAVRPNPLLALAGRKQASQSKSARRERLRARQEAELSSYQVTRECIDGLLLKLDSYERKINAWVARRD